MIRLNKNAAMLMHKYKANGATDITGFGLKGHINNLAKNQKKMINKGIKYQFYINTLPIIKNINKIDNFLIENKMINFKLKQGFSAETSGGLLIMLPKENANDFIRELYELDGWPSWIIGDIREIDNNINDEYELVKFDDKLNIIEVGKELNYQEISKL